MATDDGVHVEDDDVDTKDGSDDLILAEIQRVSALVPWIGNAWRWYDVPFRLLSWLLSGWRRHFFTQNGLRTINRWSNFFIPFNELDRQRVETTRPMHSWKVPPGEAFEHGGLWVVEFYPPSQYGSLLRSLRRNGWDKRNPFFDQDGSNAEQVERARTHSGFMWSRIGTVARSDAGWAGFDATLESLPTEFDRIEITALQIGSSLTAVACFVALSPDGRTAVDLVWKGSHEPRLIWRRGRRPHAEGRYFAAIRATQQERQRLHNLARDWLTARCPGHFSMTDVRHPVVDFGAFTLFDPELDETSREMSDGLRALALDERHFDVFVSEQLPGCALIPGRFTPRNYDLVHNCWGVVGKFDRMIQVNERRGDEPHDMPSLSREFDDAIRAFLLFTACERYLLDLKKAYATSRDLARSRHGRFSRRRLRHLRTELLTTSLDLQMVAQDLEVLWDKRLRALQPIEVMTKPIQGLSPRTIANRKPRNLIAEYRKLMRETIGELLDEDVAYRQTLVTVASLGAAIETSRLGRRALVVALASLSLSVVTILLADTGQDTLLSSLLDWLGM